MRFFIGKNMQPLDKLIDEAEMNLQTLRDFFRFSISLFNQSGLFYGHSTTNSHEEAQYLICHTLHLPTDLPVEEFALHLDSKLLDSEITKICEVLKKRTIDKIPAPYITNQAWCQGYEFYVDERVIIPRSFIPEILLDHGLEKYIPHSEVIHNVLDLCTGNGSIAIIAKDYFYDSHVVATDISKKALEVAAINVDKYAFNHDITLIESDLFTGLSEYQDTFDLILTNPPYVDSKCMANLTPEYYHEPELALAGGGDGLVLIDHILKEAPKYLNEFGILIVEMGDNVDELVNKYPTVDFKWLPTKSGEGFVFLLTRQDLEELNAAA